MKDCGRHLQGLAMLAIGVAVSGLAACGGGGGGGGDSPAANRTPLISGLAEDAVVMRERYEFVPNSADLDGDSLTFSVRNAPVWADFDATTGMLSGTPGPADIGRYENIVISVSDGELTASLAPFYIDVFATATGSATLSWESPTLRRDKTPLNDLAGFRVYWGKAEDSYAHSVQIDNPGVTTYVIDGLTPDLWYFAMTALDSSGVESGVSNQVSKLIEP